MYGKFFMSWSAQDFSVEFMVEGIWKTQKIPLKRGLRDGDAFFSKLFTLLLEDVLKIFNWDNKGVSARDLNLLHLADKVLLV